MCITVFLWGRAREYVPLSQVLSREGGREREGDLVGLLRVRDLERVKEPGASDLELGHTVGALLNLDGLGILPPRLLDEITDIRNKLGHSSKLDL